MTAGSFLRSFANHCLQPLELTLERKSKILSWQNRYVVRPTLFERALAGKETPVVLDIGASVGNTVAHVLEICPAARVFAFEPQPDQATRIKERFSDNERVKINSCGVGASNARMQLHLSSRRQSSSLLPLSNFGLEAEPFAQEEAVLDIDVITLDDWYHSLESPPKTLDLIKVDTQGFEKFVIAGGQQVFSKASYVIMEASFRPVYQGQTVYDDLVPLVKNAGFAVKAVAAGYYNRVNGELIEVDILFERV